MDYLDSISSSLRHQCSKILGRFFRHNYFKLNCKSTFSDDINLNNIGLYYFQYNFQVVFLSIDLYFF